MVRLKDVAYLAGYDISTVSKVLQGGNIHVSAEARERITRAAAELGYRPNLMARGLRTRRTGAAVLVFPSLEHPMYAAITSGAEKAASELGIVLFVYKYPAKDAGQEIINLVRQGRVDGVILAAQVPHHDFLEFATKNEVPLVTLNRHAGSATVSVVLDDEAGFSAQADYLADLGHNSISFIGLKDQSPTTQFCEQTFIQTLARRGIALAESCFFRASFDGSDVAEVVSDFLRLRNRPTAIATASLALAMRVIRELQTKDVAVPSEVSVIGYHDSTWAELTTPSVTTVGLPSFEQGYTAMIRLSDLLANRAIEEVEIICRPVKVVERESCAKISP